MRARCIPVGLQIHHTRWTAPGGDHLFTGSHAWRKGGAAPATPRKCALLGARSEAGGVDPAVPPIGAKRWKIVVCEPLTRDFSATASPSIGPREANFFPYLSIQLTAVSGIIFWGWGSLAFVWLGRCGR